MRPHTEFIVEYVWRAPDGHTRAFVECFDDIGEARIRLRQLERDHPRPNLASGKTCAGCTTPAYVVGTLRQQAVWKRDGDRPAMSQPAEEVETWEWRAEAPSGGTSVDLEQMEIG